MKNIKYFFQFLIIIILFSIYKIIGLKYSSILSAQIFKTFGPLFRSSNICHRNLITAFPKLNNFQRNEILKGMWVNYGKIFAEYLFIKDIKNSENLIRYNFLKSNIISKLISSD